MKIALDAMGGDRAPAGIVDGAYEAVAEAGGKLEVVLIGKQDVLKSYIAERGLSSPSVEIINASEVVEMSESPATAIRRKKDSSISVAMRLHKEGKVEAVVSAGNTGAVVASSLLQLGRLKGIDRPGIAIFVPAGGGGTVLLDGGANSDCNPKNILQFAVMGSVYSEIFHEKKNPTVGLLSIGEERSKGNQLTRDSYELLERSKINFVGNVEGRNVFGGDVDVVVTDGFVGNVILKFTESIFYYINDLIRSGIKIYPLAGLGALLMKPVFRRLKRKLDYAEYGGAPLLGISGVVIICHGGSSARAIKNAILGAERFVRVKINDRIKEAAAEKVNLRAPAVDKE